MYSLLNSVALLSELEHYVRAMSSILVGLFQKKIMVIDPDERPVRILFNTTKILLEISNGVRYRGGQSVI